MYTEKEIFRYYGELVESVYKGDLEEVKYLLNDGANISTHNLYDYPLILAAKYGHLDVVKFFLDRGADIHAEDDKALKFAARRDHVDVVKYLEDYTSPINQMTRYFSGVKKYLIDQSIKLSNDIYETTHDIYDYYFTTQVEEIQQSEVNSTVNSNITLEIYNDTSNITAGEYVPLSQDL